jgi:MerR family transcriptional regulator, copper efflux regulator
MLHASYLFFHQLKIMLLITQLSKQTGIPVHTIRYYENFGLFKGTKKADVKSNNYTYYDEDIIYKLNLITDGKSAGFTLSEMKGFIDGWSNKEFSVEEKLQILNEKIVSLDDKIKQIEGMKNQIELFKKQVILQ